MTPFERLVYWINERESIRRKRVLGLPPPWTDDPILQKYRFCNVRRWDDKVSQWLWKNWYSKNKDHPNMLVAVALARFFNLPRSLVGVSYWLFDELKIDWKALKTYLRSARSDGPIFNAAYMVRGNDGSDKVASVIDYTIRPLKRKPPLIDSSSMEKTHKALAGRYGFGSFMAGQVVADLRWALRGSWKDKRTWAPMGPGSRRGLNRSLGLDLTHNFTQEEFTVGLIAIVTQLERALSSDITKRLEAIDYQSCLCELDKYERARLGEGRPKQLYRGGV